MANKRSAAFLSPQLLWITEKTDSCIKIDVVYSGLHPRWPSNPDHCVSISQWARIKRQQDSGALVDMAGTNVNNNNDMMSSKWDNYSLISYTSHIRHLPYKWIALFSKSKHAFITRHPTAMWHPSGTWHLQVLLFCHISIVMSLNILWVSEESFWFMCYASFIFMEWQACQKPSGEKSGLWAREQSSIFPAERQVQLQNTELSPHFVRADN